MMRKTLALVIWESYLIKGQTLAAQGVFICEPDIGQVGTVYYPSFLNLAPWRSS